MKSADPGGVRGAWSLSNRGPVRLAIAPVGRHRRLALTAAPARAQQISSTACGACLGDAYLAADARADRDTKFAACATAQTCAAGGGSCPGGDGFQVGCGRTVACDRRSSTPCHLHYDNLQLYF